MKKIISLVLVLAMVSVLFVGCSDKKDPMETTKGAGESEVASTVESVPPVVSTEPKETTTVEEVSTEEPTTEPNTEKPSTEVVTEESNTEESSEVGSTSDETDSHTSETLEMNPEILKDAVSHADYREDPKNPAKIYSWVKAEYWNGDKEGGIYYWRITDVTADCQEEIDEWNKAGHLTQFTELTQENISYRMVTYQIYFPEDYKVGEFGASIGTKVIPTAKNPDGGGFTVDGLTYLGLGQTWSLEDSSLRYKPGDLVTCRAIFAMVDADVNYVFEGHFSDKAGEMHYGYSASK